MLHQFENLNLEWQLAEESRDCKRVREQIKRCIIYCVRLCQPKFKRKHRSALNRAFNEIRILFIIDNYVHRLIQSKGDGKLVSLDNSEMV